MSMPINYRYMVVNTYPDGIKNKEPWLRFFETEQEARDFIRDSFECSDKVEAGYLIVPLDKCVAVWARNVLKQVHRCRV